MIDRILVSDDDFLIRQVMEETIKRHKIDVVSADSGEKAIKKLKSQEFQMVFTDLKMAKVSGMDVLKFCQNECPNTLLVIMTAYGTVETAVEAMRLGAFDFIIKPFPPDQVDILIEKGTNWFQINERNTYLNQELSANKGGSKKIVGNSCQLNEIVRLAKRVAPTSATVLVTGESGTGKELIASEVHRISDPERKKNRIYE